MSAIERLTEEDIALFCILSDPSGVDLAEFAFEDQERDDNCFRLWDYQHEWFRCSESFQVERGARSVGKTLSIQLRAFAFPFNYPGQEMAITAPTLNALTRVTGLIERRFKGTRIGREILPKKANMGFTHRPFEVNFKTSCRILGVIPQLDGSGVRGIHPLVLEVDETQDMPAPAMIELVETVKEGSQGMMYRAHGVTTGARDHFHDMTQPGSNWKVHNPIALMKPTWSDAERQHKIRQYKSRNDPDYRRNIFGDHGNAENALFVMRRFLKCVDLNDSSEYNQDVYQTVYIRAEQLEDAGGVISELIPVPSIHKQKWKTFWIGVDLGLTNDPTEILVFGEHTPKGSDDSHLTLLLRVNMQRIRHQDHCEAMAHLIMKYQPKRLSMDVGGLGQPIFQDMQDRFPTLAKSVRGYNFSEKLTIGFDSTIELDEYDDEIEETKMEKRVKEAASDTLRDLVDAFRLHLPNDDDVINSFKGETYSVQKKITDIYGQKRYRNSADDHILDAARFMAMGWAQARVEAFIESKQDHEVVLPRWA